MQGLLIILNIHFFIILSVSDPFYETTSKITELTKSFSFDFVFSVYFGITYIVILHSENYENFEIYENISVMLLSFLYVSVILHPVSVTSGQWEWMTFIALFRKQRKTRNLRKKLEHPVLFVLVDSVSQGVRGDTEVGYGHRIPLWLFGFLY